MELRDMARDRQSKPEAAALPSGSLPEPIEDEGQQIGTYSNAVIGNVELSKVIRTA
jgi:hypothetical protein